MIATAAKLRQQTKKVQEVAAAAAATSQEIKELADSDDDAEALEIFMDVAGDA
jgi:hypothetical protein